MAVITNFTMYQGDDASIPITIYESDGITPQDITGWTLQFVVHKYGDPSTVYISQSTTAGTIVLTDPTSGIATASIPNASTTPLLVPDTYGFYLARVDPGAQAELTKGLLSILAQ